MSNMNNSLGKVDGPVHLEGASKFLHSRQYIRNVRLPQTKSSPFFIVYGRTLPTPLWYINSCGQFRIILQNVEIPQGEKSKVKQDCCNRNHRKYKRNTTEEVERWRTTNMIEHGCRR